MRCPRTVSCAARVTLYSGIVGLASVGLAAQQPPAQTGTRAAAEVGTGEPLGGQTAALEEGIAALEAGRLDEAESRLEEAVRAEPSTAQAWLGLALVSEQRERPGEGLVAIRRAIELEDENPRFHVIAGRLLARLGNRERAVEELVRAAALAPKEPEPRVLAALLLRDLGRDEEAIELLEAGWAAGARSAGAAEELALLHLRNAEPDRAFDVLEQAESAGLSSARLTLARGLAVAATVSRRQEAVPLLEQALAELEPERVSERFRAHLELAGLKLEAGDAREAVRHLREADHLQPDTEEVLFRLGSALRAAGELDEARAVLERFRELQQAGPRPGASDSVEDEIRTGLARAQEQANENRLDEALRTLDPLLRAHPDDARLLDLTAKVVFSLGHPREALVFVKKARELEPGSVELAFLEGLFRMQLGEPEAARTALEQAVAIDPELADGHRLLGRIALEREEWGAAAAAYQRALALGEASPEMRREYARALERLGRVEASAEQRRLADESDPPG